MFDRQYLLKDGQGVDDFGIFRFPTEQKPVHVSSIMEMLQIKAASSKDVQEAALPFSHYITTQNVTEKHSGVLCGPLSV